MAVWRMHIGALDVEKKRTDRALIAFGALGAAFATAIAYSPGVVSATPAFAAALILAGAAIAGRVSAQRRFQDKKKLEAVRNPIGAVLERAWQAMAGAARTVSAVASAIDLHVVRFASSAIGGLAFANGWLAVRAEEHGATAIPGERLANLASRTRPTARRVAVFVAVALAILLGASFARASGHAVIRTEDGRRGPVELTEQSGAWRGRFVVDNSGAVPLTISRIALREDDAVRAPRGLSVKAEGGGSTATIQPQTSKRIEIEWKPDVEMGPSQVQAHVVLTTSDEEAGEIAIGVHAQLPGPLGPFEGRLLSLLMGLPLLGALVALGIALLFPQGNARAMRIVALAVTLAQVALAVVVVRRFVPDFGHESGNDGLQLVERAMWIRPIGVEWYVGVDGHSVLLLALVSLLGALGVAASRVEREVEAQLGTYLLAIGAATGACVARDLILLVMFVGVAAIASAILIGAAGPKPEIARRASGTMAAFAIVALVAIVLSAVALRSGSTRAFLSDGSTSAHTFAMPELERVAFTRRAGMIAGVPLVELAFVLALVGFGILAGMFPFHAWMPEAAAAAPAPASLLATVIVPRLGMIGLVRVLAQILPEATRWAGTALVALGAITVLHAGACLVAERDLSKAAARFGMLHTGLVLVGIGSVTPQGLAAASAIAFAGGLATALVLLVSAALESRTGERDVEKLGGLVHETPLLAAVGIIGLLGATAVPGTAAFWAALLGVLGAAPTQPVLTLIAAAGVALGAAGAFRLVGGAFFGTVPEHWRRSANLEPFGGKFPDLRTPEAWATGALAVLIVLLGVWPAPMLDVLAGAVRDAVTRANLGPLQLGF
jgi:NADH-quinone oxidoreductase subunit M